VKRQEADAQTTGPNLHGEDSLNMLQSIIKNAKLHPPSEVRDVNALQKSRKINEGSVN
jgi:hypothetical protein